MTRWDQLIPNIRNVGNGSEEYKKKKMKNEKDEYENYVYPKKKGEKKARVGEKVKYLGVGQGTPIERGFMITDIPVPNKNATRNIEYKTNIWNGDGMLFKVVRGNAAGNSHYSIPKDLRLIDTMHHTDESVISKNGKILPRHRFFKYRYNRATGRKMPVEIRQNGVNFRFILDELLSQANVSRVDTAKNKDYKILKGIQRERQLAGVKRRSVARRPYVKELKSKEKASKMTAAATKIQRQVQQVKKDKARKEQAKKVRKVRKVRKGEVKKRLK